MNADEYVNLVRMLPVLATMATTRFRYARNWGEKRNGCVFCVANGETGIPLFNPSVILQIPEIKLPKYREFCLEKAERLSRHPEHTSSFQSRDLSFGPKRWGGAVRIGDEIWSISGYPEWGDEALGLLLAEKYYRSKKMADTRLAGKAIRELSCQIVQRSANLYYLPLHMQMYPTDYKAG